MVKLNLITAPTASTLIPTSTAKEFLRVTHSADDTLIASLVTAGMEVAQNYTNIKFLEHQYTLTMESWDDVYVSNSFDGYLYRDVVTNLSTYGGYYSKYTGLSQIVLPYPPLIEITHLKYYDSDNVQQTWSSSNYSVGTFINQKGFIEIKNGINTPDLYNRADAIEIKFKCGFGSSGSDVPEAIKQAILLIVGRMYELREDSISRLPKASEYILDPYRVKTY
tara:strand:- start:2054 stop:2719 length:666 start_codon:yes stop_codon:yes gene_type:complete